MTEYNPAILVLCQRGNVRSVTVATVLKDYGMQDDVLVGGIETTCHHTLKNIFRHVDFVLLAGVSLPEGLEPEWADVVKLDIGRDVWGVSMHPEIVRLAISTIEEKLPDLFKYTRWDKEMYLTLVDRKYELREGFVTT